MALSIQDIQLTAQTVVATLAHANLHSCLVGSCANSEHGATRIPNDIDILVLTDATSPEDLKQLIVDQNPNFYLTRPSDNPQAAYQVLWFIIERTPSAICRVDVLIPGTINLPFIPVNRIIHTGANSFPVMPILAVLLHKVLAWKAHGESAKQRARDKQIVDVGDVGELLALAVASDATLAKEDWLPQWFINASVHAVSEYTKTYSATSTRWAQILNK